MIRCISVWPTLRFKCLNCSLRSSFNTFIVVTAVGVVSSGDPKSSPVHRPWCGLLLYFDTKHSEISETVIVLAQPTPPQKLRTRCSL